MADIQDLQRLERELTAPGAAAAPKGGLLANSRARMRARAGNIVLQIPQLFSGLISPDRPTRRMSLLFLLSLAGLIVVVMIGTQRYWGAKRKIQLALAERRAQKMTEQLRKDSDAAEQRASMLNIGTFSVELKSSVPRTSSGRVFNTAEVDVVLQCDSSETRSYLDEHIVEARNQLTNVFTAIDREEFLTRDGKKKLKREIARKLNAWISQALPHAKVQDVFFSKLLMS
jgi:flagellar basal body-associated protein FliL